MNKIFTCLMTLVVMMFASNAMASNSYASIELGTVTPSGKGTIYVNDKTEKFTSGSGDKIENLPIEMKNIAAGYEFESWSVTKSDGNTGNFTIANSKSASTTISADNPNSPNTTWTYTLSATLKAITYTITYNLDGGVNAESNPATYTVESQTIVLDAPTKEGFVFAGWTEGNEIPAGSTGDKTFTATWTEAGQKVSANLQVTSVGVATFCAPFAVNLAAEGIDAKAYKAEVSGDFVMLSELTDGVIPAGTPVVLQSNTVINKTLEAEPTVTAETCTEGCLTGNLAAAKKDVAEGNYLLQNQEAYGLAWYRVANSGLYIGTNRCYLSKTTADARDFYTMDFDNTTGIDNIATEAKTKADGKYLVNGKIVIIKAGKVYELK